MHHNIPQSAGLICTQQAKSQGPARAVGCFKLSAGRAMSLTPTLPGKLRIVHGLVWVTLGHAADDEAVRAGDYFLNAGDFLNLPAGHQMVIEVVEQGTDKNAGDGVRFSWEPDAALNLAACPRPTHDTPNDVRQPLRDLGSALHQVRWALARLAQGVAGNLACTLGRRGCAAR